MMTHQAEGIMSMEKEKREVRSEIGVGLRVGSKGVLCLS